MTHRPQYQLPSDKQAKLARALVLEWTTLGFISSIVVVMYITMGNSQAMKAALIEDVLSLIPPISFLVAAHIRKKGPNREYPYGYNRVTLLAFLAAAVAILMLGLFVLYEAATTLLRQEHPTLGHFYLFDEQWQIWSGWVMIVALIYSLIPPLVLGRMKLPLARDLHESTLYADATMNKADWMTAGAAILGVIGIGAGLWWADAVAAGIIGLDVTRDGVGNLRRAMADLMDHRPAEVSTGKPLGLEDVLQGALHKLPGVREVAVRLREEGRTISGEIFVVFEDGKASAASAEAIANHAATLDWRIHDLVVMPVSSLGTLQAK